MYRIKQAAARAGVSIELLRAWERRYGVVHPARTAAGYRVYDEQAIARLQAMRQLIAQDWSPSAAAVAIRGASPERIAELASAGSTGLAKVPGTAAPNGLATTEDVPRPDDGPPDARITQSEELIHEFVAAAGALDGGRVEEVLDTIFARGSFESVLDHLVFPALVALGNAWEEGRIDVAAEHTASHAVLRRLGAAYQAAGRPGSDGAILLGLPPGSRHELGALAFGIAARRSGLPVLYLGPDLPAADWVDAATIASPQAAVVGVVTPNDRAAAARVVAALREARPDLLIALGGIGAATIPAEPRLIHLPRSLTDAVDVLRTALRSTQS